MRLLRQCCTAFVLLTAMLASARPALALREAQSITTPAVSADGQTVYFACWGDIWSAPTDGSQPARRLTDNMFEDQRPVISPDGKTLAFMSNRFGNYDIFTMPVSGGQATRLTFSDGWDYPYDWNRDGTAVLEYSNRQDLWGICLYEVPLDGSQPVRVTGPDHDDNVFGCYLGDDQHLVYTRGPGDWARKDHHGSDNYDLYMFERATGKHTQLTDYDGTDLWPQPGPGGKSIYFVSDRDGTENIWEMKLPGRELRQLTHYKGDGPRWIRVSSDGDQIAAEVFGELHLISTADGSTRKLDIHFTDDPKHEMRATLDRRNEVSEFALSPNGNYYACVVFGDIHILKNPDKYKEDEKPDQDLSRTFPVVATAGREWQVRWHPEGKKIAYISDRDGQYDVYTFDLVTQEETRITNTPQEEWYPQFAPHGNVLAYYSGNDSIMLNDLDGGGERELFRGHVRLGPWNLGFNWSPDAKWMLVMASTLRYESDALLVNVESGEVTNVTRTPDYEDTAIFSPDGKYLSWGAETQNGEDLMLLELAAEAKTYDTQLLFPDDMPKPEKEEDEAKDKDGKSDDAAADEAGKDGEDEAKGDDGKQDDEKKDEVEPIKIDLTRIETRARNIANLPGNAYPVLWSPDSSFLVFYSDHTGDPTLYTYGVDEGDVQELGSAAVVGYGAFQQDGKRLHFLRGGTLSYMDMRGRSAAGGGAVPATARSEYDTHELWQQLLYEGWRSLRDSFYDEDMLGVDWDEVYKRYSAKVPELGTRNEFNTLMRSMLGELSASHLGFFGNGDEEAPPADTTASLGVWFEDHYDGPGWKVSEVIMDGPAEIPGQELQVGDVILSLDGEKLAPRTNWYRILRNRTDRPVVLGVQREGEDEPLEITMQPVPQGSLGQREYLQWVDENRQHVEDATGGRVGYMHIQSMNGSSLAKFRRELFAMNLDRDALIIDVRFNGGGNIHDELVDLLDRRMFCYSGHRGQDRIPQPTLMWHGPIVVLMNSSSFSDAEIFPHIMKELDLATLVGEATGGNVIGTYNFPLLDGSTFRLNTWGWWLPDGTDMEGNGAQPDIEVEIDPEIAAHGGDNQLDKAIEYLTDTLNR
ncbi:MAG: PD40 domain-containing protein [Planctomycetales bacterium]|nr:PD40 domain-containing protein [bacterium]UNM07030.1 MAG: PD40 domain-containing protein [Planctomycetales bacterium]